MNICIAYETYSSTTETVVEIISKSLKEKGHTTTIKRMRDTHSVSDIKTCDLTIFATPSWFERDKEGQPHIAFLEFMDSNKDATFDGMKFALVGLGDSTYAHFCHAIDMIGGYLTEHNAIQVGETLKLDSFFFNSEAQTKRLHEWIEKLPL